MVLSSQMSQKYVGEIVLMISGEEPFTKTSSNIQFKFHQKSEKRKFMKNLINNDFSDA